MSVSQIYEETIKPLPTADRLQLATLILTGIPPQAVVDYREEWTDEDLQDWNASNWARIEAALGEE